MSEFALQCPIPISDYPQVLLAHGGGGRLMHQLIEKLFRPTFTNPLLERQHDGAVIELNGTHIAFTTDSYTVSPIFFPGGDIGKLAVFGTVNDIAVCGAKPLWLSAGFILEEGLPMETLWQIVNSMREAAEIANVSIITGDTKVVERGKGDSVFINTAGIGLVLPDWDIAPDRVRVGDAIVLSGDIGRHGTAILAAREGLEFETVIESDCAPLWELVEALHEAKIEVHCLRDLTRGGLCSAVNEIAQAANASIIIDEEKVPIADAVYSLCEILGLDPMHLACEGRFVAFVPAQQADKAVAVLKSHPLGEQATIIGEVPDEPKRTVLVRSSLGSLRILDMPSGEHLPRIC